MKLNETSPLMIDALPDLRQHYPEPSARAQGKSIDHLDVHCRRFIALAPFVVLATVGSDGQLDASPRGGATGFVRCVDDHTLWLPDASGNNRLDSLSNIVETGRVGVLFLIPGIDETLRLNGAARLREDDEALSAFPDERKPPRVVLEITVQEVFLHCAKALMRSKLWDAERHQERSVLPTMREMLNAHTGLAQPPETQEEMRARYAPDV
ncbi:MAG: pyridoxamine 5'-phosphate oxidase family protein [Rubricoccaceae bacterium]